MHLSPDTEGNIFPLRHSGTFDMHVQGDATISLPRKYTGAARRQSTGTSRACRARQDLASPDPVVRAFASTVGCVTGCLVFARLADAAAQQALQ